MLAPIYAGLSEPVRALFTWASLVISTLMKKLVYIVYAIGVTDQNGNAKSLDATTACLDTMGLQARAYGDAFVESLPSAAEFFLDVKEGFASEGEEPVCGQYEHENLILAGSLKTYKFVSDNCNVRYSGGTAIHCSMEDGISGASHCTGFQVGLYGLQG